MNTKELLPKGVNLDEIPTVKYLQGFPVQYRFNASTGVLSYKGEQNLTKKGEAFTIVPVAYRQFNDDILGMGKKNWFELYFINNKNQVGCLLLHGYSVENLSSIFADLFYDDAKLFEVALTIKPTEKQNKTANSTYYIAEFSFDKLSASDVEHYSESVKGMNLYRVDTLTEVAQHTLLHNFTEHLQLCA